MKRSPIEWIAGLFGLGPNTYYLMYYSTDGSLNWWLVDLFFMNGLFVVEVVAFI